MALTNYSIFGSGTPSTPNNVDPATITLGVKFKVTKGCYVTHLRCYWHSAASNFTKMTLWAIDAFGDNAGVIVTKNLTDVTPGGGWVEQPLDTPIYVYPGNEYVVGFTTTNGGYSTNAGSYPSGSIVTNAESTGRFIYADSFPNSPSGTGTSYGADVVVSYDPAITQSRIWDNTVGISAVADSADITLGTHFTVSEDSLITHLRAPDYLNTVSSLKLWNADTTTELASVSKSIFTGIIAELELGSPVLIVPGTRYLVSAYYAGGRYTPKPTELTSDIVSGSLTGTANEPSGFRNGVFTYATGHTYPTGSFNNSSYFADVVAIPYAAPPTSTLSRRRPFVLFS